MLGDATEAALLKWSDLAAADLKQDDSLKFQASNPRVTLVPFNSVAKTSSFVHQISGDGLWLILKGLVIKFASLWPQTTSKFRQKGPRSRCCCSAARCTTTARLCG